MPKLNICVVGLAKDFTDKVCSELANSLELYYANVEKILEFELFDSANIEKVCGRDYLLKEQKSIIKRLCSYEDTLINLNYFNLNNDDTLNLVKNNCLLVYLHLDEKRFNSEIVNNGNNAIFDISLFLDRDKICMEEADIVVDCKDFNVDDVATLVAESIIIYYA